MSLINDLFKMHIRSKLPRLKRTLINRDDVQTTDSDAQRLMMVGLARDEYAASDLKSKYDLSVDELIRLLGKPRKADWKRRLMSRLRNIEGSYEYNPHGPELRAIRRGERTSSNTWM